MDAKRELIKTKLKVFIAKKRNPELSNALKPEVQHELVERLLDGTTCAIVDSLKDLQEFKESELAEERETKVSKIKARGGNVDNEIREFDLQILKQFDEVVSEQQNHLACALIPLFKITKDPKEIQIQMEIMEFIASVSSILTK